MKRITRPHLKPGPKGKNTPEDVRLIRALKGQLTAKEVAQKMEISWHTVKAIWRGLIWNKVWPEEMQGNNRST